MLSAKGVALADNVSRQRPRAGSQFLVVVTAVIAVVMGVTTVIVAVAVIMAVRIATDGAFTAWGVAVFPFAVMLAGNQWSSSNRSVDGDGARVENE